METLHVARMRTRYRLPERGGDTRARLERVLREVLDDGLESALARSGVATHEEICLRSAHAPVRLSAASPDSTLVAAWSVALADSIRRAIQEGGADVVRYATLNHALVDLLVGVATGELRRAWAWRQLGLWSASDAPTPEGAGAEAVRALLARPEAVVAALAGAARSGALPGLVRALPRAGWVEIARAALRAASVDPEPILRAIAAAPPEPRVPAAPAAGSDSVQTATRETDAVESPALSPRRAARLARGSAIAIALADLPHAQVELRRLLALLAMAEADPGELRRGAAHAAALALLVEMETRAAPRLDPGERTRDGGESAAARAERRTPDPRRPSEASPDRPAERADDPEARARELAERTGKTTPRSPDARDREIAPGDEPEAGAERELTAKTRRERPDEHAAPDDDRVVSLEAGDEADEAERPLPELRASAVSEWGGVLFLLHVVGELGLPAEIADAEVFRARSTRWVLHAVARSLLHLDELDPAALAFAGLAPDAELPWEGEDPASEAELSAVAALALRVAARAFERLRGEPPEDERTALAAVRVCARRRAEIAAEPGWMDVMLRLDEVSVEVRRAGLDLDPGWIPWLGIVMRFVYG